MMKEEEVWKEGVGEGEEGREAKYAGGVGWGGTRWEGGHRLLFGGRSGLWGTREKRGAQHYDAKMARLRHPRISSSTRHWPLGKPLLR